MRITRKNRDRRGGHESSMIYWRSGFCYDTIAQRALSKKLMVRELRRNSKLRIQEEMDMFLEELEELKAEHLELERIAEEYEENCRSYWDDDDHMDDFVEPPFSDDYEDDLWDSDRAFYDPFPLEDIHL